MSAWSRLSLYLLAMEVALVNGCLPQAEAMLKAAITLLADLPNLTGTGPCPLPLCPQRARHCHRRLH
jgi:hypothetical protein